MGVGTSDMGNGDQKVAVEYKVTSNGSAVIETLFPETPNEMVSVYHDLNGRLVITHYCSLGNQPQMELESSSGSIIKLEFSGNSNIRLMILICIHSRLLFCQMIP